MANPEPETSSRSSSRPTQLAAGQACRPASSKSGSCRVGILQSTRFQGLTTSSFANRLRTRRSTCSQTQSLHFARVLARRRASASRSIRDMLFLFKLQTATVLHRRSLHKASMQFDVEAVQYKLMSCTGSTGCRALMTPNEFKGIRNRSSVLTPAQERRLAADFHDPIKDEELPKELRQREAESDRSPTFRHCGAKVFAPTVTTSIARIEYAAIGYGVGAKRLLARGAKQPNLTPGRGTPSGQHAGFDEARRFRKQENTLGSFAEYCPRGHSQPSLKAPESNTLPTKH